MSDAVQRQIQMMPHADTWTAEPGAINDAVAEVITAANDVELKMLSPAIRAGVTILDHLDPAVYAALMRAIDGN
jgi:hypothetical protein